MLIGIIVIVLSNIQSTLLSKLISSELGEIEGGNFVYYKYPNRLNFKLELESFVGDCDLYISDRYHDVNYSNYDFQSTTYGKDEILIDDELKRPIYAAVYAHPYYSTCKYALNQYADPDLDLIEDEKINDKSDDTSENSLWWLFIHFLELLAEVFL